MKNENINNGNWNSQILYGMIFIGKDCSLGKINEHYFLAQLFVSHNRFSYISI